MSEGTNAAKSETTLTNREFSLLSGLSAGHVSRRAQTGMPITLEEARRIRSQKDRRRFPVAKAATK